MKDLLEDQKPKKAAPSYTMGTHIIDKVIFNLFIGFIVAVSLIVSVVSQFLRVDAFSCIPLILLVTIAVCLIYAFFGIGVHAAKTKEAGYKVSPFAASCAAIAGSFAFVFPIAFIQMVLNLLGYLIPRYNQYLDSYIPRFLNMKNVLAHNFCKSGDFCIFSSSLGVLVGAILDSLLLALGLAVVFSVVNSIIAFITASSKEN